MSFIAKWFLAVLGVIGLLAFASPALAQPATRPAPRVMIVSIDGCRPDMLLRADAPTVRGLMRSGAFTFWARTTALSVTLPSHTSMLTGVTPRRHEIEWNIDLPLSEPVYPKFPTLFEVAHRRGYTTAMAAGKSKFATLAKPGTLDYCYVPASEKSDDADVVDHAVDMIRDHRPQVLFVHLPSTDNVGHKVGWGSAEQLATIEAADKQIARLLAALEAAGVRGETFIVVTADHGGAGRTHQPDDPRARHIPWIAVGPGVRKNLDLTTFPDLTLNTEDTFATACRVLKIPLDPRLDGKVVHEAFDVPDELLSVTR